MSATLSAAVAEFGAYLHDEHGFALARGKAPDALRAAEIVGIAERSHLRAALRAVFCSTPEDVARFDAAFDAFFTGAQGAPQAQLPPRRIRREPEDDPSGTPREEHAPARDGLSDAAITWQRMRARASPAAARAAAPAVAADGLDAMLVAADRFIAVLRLGRSRRWRPAQRGRRFDVRRTLRASMQTGGDPIALHRLGPPRRNPRIVLLIDGSRSMADRAGPALQLAHALVRRSRRARAFVFSTALCDVTRALRRRDAVDTPLDGLAEAWGGGTRIGDALRAFITDDAALLDRETVVVIASDGLDAGDLDVLGRAMHKLRARTAGIVWLHPDAAQRGFRPASGGIRTALPYLRVLAPMHGPSDVVALARYLRLRP